MLETLLVRDVMTPAPLTIEAGRSVAEARALMREGAVRHLPVMDAEAGLVGLLSERDLALLEAQEGRPAEDAPVSEAMARAPWTVSPETPLEVAVRHMAAHHLGSSVVVDNARVVGILTSTDGLRALAMVLARGREGGPTP